jgi:hypothetical protein
MNSGSLCCRVQLGEGLTFPHEHTQWRKRFVAPFSDMANVLKDRRNEISRPRQDIQEFAGEILRLPNAKRTRLD